METTDKLLIGLKNGDKSVFEIIYREYYVPLCYFCVKYVDNLSDAEEIVQEVFVKVWEKHAEVEINTSLKSYLHRSVQNSALNYIKKQKVIDKYKQSEEGGSRTSYHDGQSNMEDAELRMVIKKAILELPEKRREIFELSRFEGMKYSKIADTLSISVKTVENQMTKALKYLRVVLKDYSPILILALELYKNIGLPK